MNLTWKERFCATFCVERIFCRLIAAWSMFVAILLLSSAGFAKLSYLQDTPLWHVALWTLALFAAMSVIALLLAQFHTDSLFLLLGATLCVIRWLLEFENGNDEFLFVLAVIAVYSLFVVYTLRVNDALLRQIHLGSRSTMGLALLIGIITYAVIATITCLRYKTFSSPNFDFGLFTNMFYNMAEHGVPNVTSERDMLLSCTDSQESTVSNFTHTKLYNKFFLLSIGLPPL